MNMVCEYFSDCERAKQAITMCVLAGLFIWGLYLCEGEGEQ